ncbi:MAG: MBL fold metallo-hydrolase [Deltaproteobacteria bacterium]|nr:MBL fold metallo-hydrolase [Candidatus Zymogenaceae bacterium]
MSVSLKEVDKVEILTLQDNYVDLILRDNSEVVLRAMPLKDMEVKNSILAEHGFSSLVTVTSGDVSRSVLFDFGFSAHGAAFNADALGVDLSVVETAALSHGHLDHTGGIEELGKRIKKPGLSLYLHPEAFRNPRYLKVTEDIRVGFPSFTRERAKKAGFEPVERSEPTPLLDGQMLFLGGVPRKTDFERVGNDFFFERDGVETQDDIADDTSIVANLKGKGLIVLSGCAHSGIINTTNYAKEVTGIGDVHVIMGGFHLNGADFDGVIKPTADNLISLDPAYIIPTHCTGREAIGYIEERMSDKFILNMAGTKLTFAA